MKRLLKSFGYALKGIKMVISTERNMQIHVFIAVFVVFLGALFHISTAEWLICVVCIALVFSAETLNTAFETFVDFVSPERKPEAGKIKDIAAGAVLLAAIMSVIAGVIIFMPKIIAFIR